MDKINLLKEYLQINMAPILVDFIFGSDIPMSIVLESDIDESLLYGKYVGGVFSPPTWFEKISFNKNPVILVINNIDGISKCEQKKFLEILKYRKVNTFELPSNTVIMVSAKVISSDTIDADIYAQVVHIKN